ncbi:hypothetical protein RQP46_004130 [Phenoliferia psychrophenolica]
MQSGSSHAELLSQLLHCEGRVCHSSARIATILHTLVQNASHRIEAVVQLDAVRRSRDTVRQLELVAQQTNHESLESARGELANQSRWAGEIRTLVEDAARDGVERARLDDSDDDPDDEEEEGGGDVDGREGVGRDIRVQTYRLQVRPPLSSSLLRTATHSHSADDSHSSPV